MNVATFHAYGGFSPAYEFGQPGACGGYVDRLHGRIAVSAAARHFIDRYFPGDYKVIPNGVDIERFRRAVPIARWQDGTPNILFVGRFEPRKGLLDLLKAYRILRKTGCDCRLLVVGSGPAGARGAALHRDPPARAASSSSAGSATRRGTSCSGPPTSTSRPPPAASRSASCCSRRWPPGTRSSPLTSTATRASSGAAARRCSCRRASRRRSPARSPGSCRDDELRGRDGGRGPRAGRGVQLGAGHRQGRRLLRLRDPPPRRAGRAARGLHAPSPAVAAGLARRPASRPRGDRPASAAAPPIGGSSAAAGPTAAPAHGPPSAASPARSPLVRRPARPARAARPRPRSRRRAQDHRQRRAAAATASERDEIGTRRGRVFTGNWNG